jgi:hypothetical protein
MATVLDGRMRFQYSIDELNALEEDAINAVFSRPLDASHWLSTSLLLVRELRRIQEEDAK